MNKKRYVTVRVEKKSHLIRETRQDKVERIFKVKLGGTLFFSAAPKAGTLIISIEKIIEFYYPSNHRTN